MTNQSITIQSSKFLDLLMSVYLAAAKNEDREYINAVHFEIYDNKIHAIATDGKIMSYCQQDIGYSTDQLDCEDITNDVSDTEFTIKLLDIELLVVTLKKMKVKRNVEDLENPSFIVIKEELINGKQEINFSMLGSSSVILKPTLINNFIDWRSVSNFYKKSTPSYISTDMSIDGDVTINKLILKLKSCGTNNKL